MRATSVKIMQDGVCETHTAAMLDPYLDAHGHTTDNRGLSFIAADDLAAYVAALDAEDFQVHVHALGDRAGIRRYGSALVPMDESLAECAIDISGRPLCTYEADLPATSIAGFDTELAEEFFRAETVLARMLSDLGL